MAGWTSVEQIIAYQLSVKLRDEIIAIARGSAIAEDFKFRNQITDAAASAPRNISEGFERYKHGQFGYHVGVAKGSLGELKTHLIDAKTRGYITDQTFTRLCTLLSEAKATTTGLLKHLQTSEAPEPSE